MDTPGILWPKFENQEVGYNLAITGAIRDEILPIDEVACVLIEKMLKMGKKQVLKDKYKLLEEDFEQVSGAIIESIALRMNMLQKGGNFHVQQATYTLLRDYRACKLGIFGLDMDIAEEIKHFYTK